MKIIIIILQSSMRLSIHSEHQKAKEEIVFMRLFPHYLIGKGKNWYLDQPVQIMTNWYSLEENFLNWFFPHNKFM